MLTPCHAALSHVGYICPPQNTLFITTQAWEWVGCRGVSEIVSGSKYCAVTQFVPGVVWGWRYSKCNFRTAVKIYFLGIQQLILILCLVFAFSYTEVVVVASKEIRIEVNLVKLSIWSCVAIRMRGRSHKIKTGNSSFERVEQFKYWGTTLTIKILFRLNLRADRRQGMLVINRCRIFCRPVCYPKM